MTPRLTIVLGGGGVGKTTLASALALAHAAAGERVALLGVDPARRLRSALGIADVPELGVAVPLAGAPVAVLAALLDPSASLRRWVGEALPDPAARARLLASPYFAAIADRLAGFGDAIGCARAVELAESHPDLAHLVLDTAPGVAAVELLARPEKLMAFFDGRLLRWLVRLGRLGRGGRMFAGLADLSGAQVLRDFGQFAASVERAIETLIARLRHVRAWLADPSTSLVIVSAASDSAVAVALELDRAVRELGLAPTLVALDRVLPAALAGWTPRQPGDAPAAFARYLHNQLALQDRARARLAAAFSHVVDIPDADALDAPSRLAALALLGEPLRAALARTA